MAITEIGSPDFMERISKSAMADFFSRRPFSVVHIDAEWDGHRKAVAEQIAAIEAEWEPSVSFGYVDCDVETEYPIEIGILAIPCVAYYSGSSLYGIVGGWRQNIGGNIQRMMRGAPLEKHSKNRMPSDGSLVAKLKRVFKLAAHKMVGKVPKTK